jgi:hypothetical protein
MENLVKRAHKAKLYGRLQLKVDPWPRLLGHDTTNRRC